MDNPQLERFMQELEKSQNQTAALAVACANILAQLPETADINKEQLKKAIEADTRGQPMGSRLDSQAISMGNRILKAAEQRHKSKSSDQSENQ
jgi:hypothetical protein